MAARDPSPPPSPDLDAALAEATELALRAARALTRLVEIEQTTAEALAAFLPEPAFMAHASLAQAAAFGHDIDAVAAHMAAATPRTNALARNLDRMLLAVRRAVALRRRLQTGWPRAQSADDRPAMQRRQVARSVAKRIRDPDQDAPERLFDDLDAYLDDPALDAEIQAHGVEAVVDRICRDIAAAAAPHLHPATASPAPPRTPHPPDTG